MMIKKLAFAILLSSVACVPWAAQAVTIEDIQAMQREARAGAFGGRAHTVALSYYIQGAMEAIALAQQTLEKADKPPLFCPPKNSKSSAEEVYAIIDTAARDGKTGPVLPIILEDFKARYPCKNER